MRRAAEHALDLEHQASAEMLSRPAAQELYEEAARAFEVAADAAEEGGKLSRAQAYRRKAERAHTRADLPDAPYAYVPKVAYWQKSHDQLDPNWPDSRSYFLHTTSGDFRIRQHTGGFYRLTLHLRRHRPLPIDSRTLFIDRYGQLADPGVINDYATSNAPMRFERPESAVVAARRFFNRWLAQKPSPEMIRYAQRIYGRAA